MRLWAEFIGHGIWSNGCFCENVNEHFCNFKLLHIKDQANKLRDELIYRL
jgi:hypothetical protein